METNVYRGMGIRQKAHRLEEFVFSVLCTRVRRNLEPLEPRTIRGVMGRCGLRPADLLELSRRPLDLLNEDLGDADDRAYMSQLLTGAVIRKMSGLKGPKQDNFVTRLAPFLSTLHESTPYRVLSAEEWSHGAPDDQLLARLYVSLGWRQDATLAVTSLAAELPPMPPVSPPSIPTLSEPAWTPADMREFPVSLETLPEMEPSPRWLRHSALALVKAELPPIAPHELPPLPRLDSTAPVPGLPKLGEAMPLRYVAQDFTADISPPEAKMQRWERIGAKAAGWGGVGVGTPVFLEGLVDQSVASLTLGGLLVFTGLVTDFALTRHVRMLQGREKEVVNASVAAQKENESES